MHINVVCLYEYISSYLDFQDVDVSEMAWLKMDCDLITNDNEN